ncbi:MAG: Tol-Pal system subunit TolQ, partial [Paracoccaceae bacterium]
METQALELAHQVDFSFWALFLRATLTVKIVMLLLILASFWSWSIIFQRHIKYRGARKEAA